MIWTVVVDRCERRIYWLVGRRWRMSMASPLHISIGGIAARLGVERARGRAPDAALLDFLLAVRRLGDGLAWRVARDVVCRCRNVVDSALVETVS